MCMGGFICTFSLSISLSITLQTSKFRNQYTISSKDLDMVRYLKQERHLLLVSLLSYSKMTSELIIEFSFELLPDLVAD